MKDIMENKDTNPKDKNTGKITRKEALTKAGKYAAFTAAAMMMVTGPAEGQSPYPKKSPIKPRPRPR